MITKRPIMIKPNEQITVLIPTYNRRSMLMQAVQSIMDQTYKHFTMLIYDDGSTDDTEFAVKTLIESNYPIKYVHCTKNNGISFVRNRLLDLCETRIAAWQDSDDISHPLRLEMQANHMKDYELVYTAFTRMERNNTMQNDDLQIANNFANASAMFLVDRSIRFDLGLVIAEDNNWRARMKKIYTTFYMPEALYSVRFHQDRLGVKYRGTRKRNLAEEAK